MTPWQQQLAILEEVAAGKLTPRQAATRLDAIDRSGFGFGSGYVVELRGRNHAAFIFARDAEHYVDLISDEAISPATRVDPGGRAEDRRLLYGREDYAIRDAASSRKVVGTTGHGHAILAALDRAEGKS